MTIHSVDEFRLSFFYELSRHVIDGSIKYQNSGIFHAQAVSRDDPSVVPQGWKQNPLCVSESSAFRVGIDKS